MFIGDSFDLLVPATDATDFAETAHVKRFQAETHLKPHRLGFARIQQHRENTGTVNTQFSLKGKLLNIPDGGSKFPESLASLIKTIRNFGRARKLPIDVTSEVPERINKLNRRVSRGNLFQGANMMNQGRKRFSFTGRNLQAPVNHMCSKTGVSMTELLQCVSDQGKVIRIPQFLERPSFVDGIFRKISLPTQDAINSSGPDTVGLGGQPRFDNRAKVNIEKQRGKTAALA